MAAWHIYRRTKTRISTISGDGSLAGLLQLLKTAEKAFEIGPLPIAKGVIGVAIVSLEAVYVRPSPLLQCLLLIFIEAGRVNNDALCQLIIENAEFAVDLRDVLARDEGVSENMKNLVEKLKT
jgi:hypothetical protein